MMSAEQSVAQIIAQNPGFMVALQESIGKLVGKSSGYVESLPNEVQRRINALKNLNLKHVELEAQFKADVAELEKKYLKLYSPLYDQRAQIVAGKYEPNDEECEYESEVDDDDENEEGYEDMDEDDESDVSDQVNKLTIQEEAGGDGEAREPIKGVPGFWVTAMQNCPDVRELVQEHDVPLLEHLADVRLSYLDGEDTGFRLDFRFEPNEFIKNEVLSKTYFFMEDDFNSDMVLDRAEGCAIQWATPEANLTKTKTRKQSKNKSTGQVRTKVVFESRPSFFNFFSPPAVPDDDDEDEEAMELVTTDFRAGSAFKTDLIPHAVMYFTGDAVEDDDESQYEDESGSDDEGDAEDGEGSDSEADPDYDPSKDRPAECKQQ